MEEPPSKIRKRVREACENCRRKKGKCPGEKPVCSLCERLGQTCVYAGDGAQEPILLDGISDIASAETNQFATSATGEVVMQGLERHVRSLDGKVTEILDKLQSLASLQGQPQALRSQNTRPTTLSPAFALPTTELMRKAARLYLKYCHCQPLSIFSPTDFELTIDSRDPEVRLCVAGLSLRFDVDETYSNERITVCHTYLQDARSLVMTRIAQGRVEISTLQSLCLLALAEFNDDQPHRSGTSLALACELARCARLDVLIRQTPKSSKADEHVRCLWSIIMLQYLTGGVGLMSTTIDTTHLKHPPSDGKNALATAQRQNSSTSQDAKDDLGVTAYAAQMTEVWHNVRQYVHHRGKLDKHPPWSGQSLYSHIMFRQMEHESQMPHKHRFKPSGFSEHSISTLSGNRFYWAPWLYLQIIYHAIVCTLNHPLLLSIYIRRFRVNQIPELFLQQTADMITSHTDWIIHLLDIAMEKEFEFSDPFVGQCIAIAATIFLQQSYTEDQVTRIEKQGKYKVCLRVVQQLGRSWPHVEKLAIDLQQFERTVSRAFEQSLIDDSPDMSRSVDLTIFWRVMSNSTRANMASDSNSIFGPSLRQLPLSQNEAEIFSTHLLPEPTRVNSLHQNSGSAISTPAARYGGDPLVASNSNVPGNNYLLEPLIDTPFLAQNFFALGQDFVGNADDWFNWTEIQTGTG